MDWINFLGAFGIGALVVKLLDIYLLQSRSIENDHLKWVREKKYEAFSLLAKDLLSMGQSRTTSNNPFEGFTHASQSILLLNDKDLAHQIDVFIGKLDRLYSFTGKPEYKIEGNELYEVLSQEARQIIDKLHDNLMSKKYR